MGGIDSAGLHLKSMEGWISLNPGISSNGTDDCGFALLPSPKDIRPRDFTTKDDGYIGLSMTVQSVLEPWPPSAV